MKQSIFYLFKRCFQLGPCGLVSKIYYHHRKTAFIKKYKAKALHHQAAKVCHSRLDRESIVYPLSIKNDKSNKKTWIPAFARMTKKIKSFLIHFSQIAIQLDQKPIFEISETEDFFNKPERWLRLEVMYNHPLFRTYRPTHEALMNTADQIIASNHFLLGSPVKPGSWHDDFTIPTRPFKTFTNQDFGSKAASTFYADISLPPSTATDFSNYSYDVKAPWERSRFNEFFALGYAYQTTHDERYALYFNQTLTSWLDENPYLLGVNWICPMDVAIRAINMLWALYFFRQSSSCSKLFLERVVCSLYDHFVYLDNNWEYSDKPNNHYITELLGFAYLCTFFDKHKKFSWAKKKLNQQWKLQIQPDGTSYEGSTAYHRLDTELCLHALMLDCVDKERFNPMMNFLENIAIQQNTIIHIGDDDSGKIVTGITITPTPHNFIKTYQHFGLTVIKHNSICITFRHPTLKTQQPTGHFHHDQLALTLSIDGQQILSDPGSYLYTSSPAWRNHFRSYNQHNTLYIICSCCTPTNNLFQLVRQKKITMPIIEETKNTIFISNWYKPCRKNPLKLFRTLIFNKNSFTLSVTDHAEENHDNTNISWNLLLHPGIIVNQKNAHTTLKSTNAPQATFSSPLTWEQQHSFYAPHYGEQQSCRVLQSNDSLAHPITHIIQLNMKRTKTQ